MHRVELRQLFFNRAAVGGVGLVSSVWLLAGLSYAFTNSTFNYGNLVASKAAFASAWVPDAEQIGDADGVRGWLTDALTDIVENPLRDGHARVMAAFVRFRTEQDDFASACPTGATFTTEAPGVYSGLCLPSRSLAHSEAMRPRRRPSASTSTFWSLRSP